MDILQALRDAGGDAWDGIDDPEAFLGRTAAPESAKETTMLTVEQLRNFLAGLPGDAPVRVDLATTYRGDAVTLTGPASSVMMSGGVLVLDGATDPKEPKE